MCRLRSHYLPRVPFFHTLFLPPPGGAGSVGFPRRSSLLVTGRPGVGKVFFSLALVRDLMCSVGEEHLLYYIGIGEDSRRLCARYEGYGWFVEDDPFFSRNNRAYFIDIHEGDLPQPTRGAEELINPVMGKVRRLEALHHEAANGVFVVVNSLTALVKDSRAPGDRRRNIREVIDRLIESLGGRLALTVLIAEGGEPGGPLVTPEEEYIADFVFRLKVRDIGFGRRAREIEVVKYLDGTPMLQGNHSWEELSPANLNHVVASQGLQESIRKDMEADKRGDGRWGTILVAPYPRLPAIGDLQRGEPDGPTDPGEPGPAGGPASDIVEADVPGRARGDGAARRAPGSRPLKIETGTPGLDEMIGGDSSYWARPVPTILAERADGKGSLYAGSTTLLLGRAGTGKTICCLQFLLAEEEPEMCLYVNFENRPLRVIDWFPGDEESKERLRRCKMLYRRRSHLDLNLLICEIYHLVSTARIERVAIDGLSDLRSVLDERDYSRLVEDLLVSIRKAYRDRSREGAGDEDSRRQVTIFITLEADASPAVVSRFDADSFADNVLVLRQITLNDEQRKTIQAVKARGQAPDRLVRELVVLEKDRYPLRVVPGLENYRNLFEGTLEPVRVTLQLVEENGAERDFNRALMRHLRRLFGYGVTSFGFARDEITRTLLDIASGVGRIPHSDIKLLNIDEWWVRELRLPGRHEPGKYLVEQQHPLLALNAFLSRGKITPAGAPTGDDEPGGVVLPSDFWIFEMEKASVPLLHRVDEVERPADGLGDPDGDGRATWTLSADVVALPSYLDFGLFCLHRPLAEGLGIEPSGEGGGHGPPWLDSLPLRWAQPEGRWFARPEPDGQPGSLVDLMARLRTRAKDLRGVVVDPIGFAFDMETTATMVCTFLELCWAFGAAEDFFIADVCHHETLPVDERRAYLEGSPPAAALRLLAFLVLEGLMPPRTSLADARRALFSRHWLSSLIDVDPATRPGSPPAGEERGEGAKKKPEERRDSKRTRDQVGERADPQQWRNQDHLRRSQAMVLHPLPFFPVGSGDTTGDGPLSAARHDALVDALRRYDRLLARVLAAVDYREGLWGDGAADWKELRQWRSEVDGILTRVRGPAGRQLTDEDFAKILDFLHDSGREVRQKARASDLFQVGQGAMRGPWDGDKLARWCPTFPHPDSPGERLWRRLPAGLYMDLRDVMLLLDWHELRIDLLRADRDGRPLSRVVRGMTHPGTVPEVAEPAKAGSPGEGARRPSTLTGYACEGSWMVGVDRTTRSPSLAVKFLTEMTSSARAEERGAAVAGIPAHKNFFDFHGHEPVPFLPAGQMTWSLLLRLTGSRARRRERTFCSRLRVSDLFTAIQQRVLHTLAVAAELREDYLREPGSDRGRVIAEVSNVAGRSVAEMYRAVRSAMVRAAREEARRVGHGRREDPGCEQDPPPTPCLMCPDPSACRKVLLAEEGHSHG